ncbi:MAG: branched-chain amino acid ABC transporter permease [Deltaproteobacteria bacterium]|nr:branched-chain amino acid ABC transporter permease [Deltaproteobacteria bacterium]
MNNIVLRKPFPHLFFIAVALVFPFVYPSEYAKHVFALIFIKIILCMSLRQMLLTGLLNLSIVSFMAIGAYFTAVLGTTIGMSFWIVMPLSGLICSLIGLLFAFPVLRLKGAYFFIGTICFAVCVQTFFSNFYVETFGGVPGFTPIDVPHIKLPGFELDFMSHLSYYYLTFIIMLLSIVIFYRLENSRFGQYWKAISFADRLIETVGVDLLKSKILNFTISCFFAGIAGSLFAPLIGIITPHDFDLLFMFFLVMFVVVGGTDSFWGPITGVIAISILAELLRDFGQYETIGYGFILVLALIFMPRGICGLMERFISSKKEAIKSPN